MFIGNTKMTINL